MKRVPIERLYEVFTLDAENGVLYWKQKIAKKVVVGARAGSLRRDGYYRVQVNHTALLVHHVVFAMVYGRWPLELDHANQNPSDNSLANLREATRSENNYNRCTKPCATSGLKGVFMQARGKTWVARLTHKKVKRRVGGFKTKELALEFLELWRDMAHGVFANHEAY